MLERPTKVRPVAQARKIRKPRRRPLTTTRAALLEHGSDHKFRKLIYGVFTLSATFELIRSRFSNVIGITGPQFSMLMAIADLSPKPGILPSKLATALHVSRPFITTECEKLFRAGLVRKQPDLSDARSALLTITEKGLNELGRVMPIVRGVNDTGFRSFSRTQFNYFCKMLDVLVADSQAALTVTTGFGIYLRGTARHSAERDGSIG